MVKLKDDGQSTKSTKSQSSTKTITSSLVNKAKSGLATLKCKAMEVLSPKKKKLQVSLNSVIVFNLEMARDSPIAKEHAGLISFATDAWTLLNHLTYVAVTAHLEVRGKPICIVLDVIELPMVRRYLISILCHR